jgi:hypothetical protein
LVWRAVGGGPSVRARAEWNIRLFRHWTSCIAVVSFSDQL